jgi:hypothetical protein
METVVKKIYICLRAEICPATLCGHRKPHKRDVEGRKDYCKRPPAWAHSNCPNCVAFKVQTIPARKYKPDPRD